MNPFGAMDFRDRRACFEALGHGPFDVLVIGGGITGCGVARDAAMRGLSVALIEADDIGSGTSSRSSKLIHGGLRYLAQGDFLVVREAATERRSVRSIAPHLATTMEMVIPVRKKTGLAKMRAALWSYEKLGGVDEGERHQVWDERRLRTEEPSLRSKAFIAAVVYPEYLTDDFRLTLGNARSAAAHGAVVLTYAKAEALIVEHGRAVGAVIRGTLPGEGEGAEVRGRVVVNAAGPWLDAVRRLEDPRAEQRLQLTKGIHLVLARNRLPLNRTVIMPAADRRSIFAIPRERFVYVGTTDTAYPGSEYWPEITAQDVDYLLEPLCTVLDVEPVRYGDIVSAWSGLRPLLGQEGKKPSEISRRHETLEGPGGMLSIAGGKLTAYRSMAERVVDRCEEILGRKPTLSKTAEEPLPGGDLPGSLSALRSRLEGLGLDPFEAERAARLYGTEAPSVFSNGYSLEAEVGHAVEKEGALTLEDYWVRRSARARFDDAGGLASLAPAAEAMGDLLGWSEQKRASEIDACRRRRAQELAALSGGSADPEG